MMDGGRPELRSGWWMVVGQSFGLDGGRRVFLSFLFVCIVLFLKYGLLFLFAVDCVAF
jgi:hypothetical protein